MIEIRISEDIEDAGVTVTLGCIECRVTITEEDAALGVALEQAAADCRTQLGDRPVSEVPRIADTRRAYRALGKDPSRYRPSAEALLRRIVQGKDLYRINSAVDSNNLISLRTGFSIGAYDRAALRPPIGLYQGPDGLSYEAIGRGAINLAGLPVLIDAAGPFGSPTSDSERSKVTAATELLLMVMFDFGDVPEIEETLDFAAETLVRHCAASDLETWLVDNLS